jgi:hypothetical protein
VSRRHPARPPVLAAAAALLLAGCGSTRPEVTGTTTLPEPTPELRVRAAAHGPGDPAALARAAARATPELEGFLGGYLAVAFQPGGGDRAAVLRGFFDPGVHAAVGRDLPALAPGAAGGARAALAPGSATATFLVDAVRPLAATVVLELTGTAGPPRRPVPVGLRGRFQLLRGPRGWRIAAYETRARVAV